MTKRYLHRCVFLVVCDVFQLLQFFLLLLFIFTCFEVAYTCSAVLAGSRGHRTLGEATLLYSGP